MTLPFVSRAAFDAVVTLHQASERAWAERYDRLATRYHDLILRGATPTPAPEPVAPPVQRDPVRTAIAQVCGGDRLKAAQMERQAMLDRAAGVADDLIIRNILTGVTPDDLFGIDSTAAGISMSAD